MYNPNGTVEERDLNLQMCCFFIVEFNKELDSYQQCSARMSLENAHKYCVTLRKSCPTADIKVHGELENF